jgi:DNA-binding SARP family transcriptional activator
MEFRILGPLEARENGVVLALGGAKQRALLAVLLLHSNEVVSTDALIDALWEKPPQRPAKAVQVYVSRLRKALGGAMPVGRTAGYLLELAPEQLDLARFQRLVHEARREPANAADKLTEALAIWRGPALAEFGTEPFARVERLHLEELRVEALEARIEAELTLGRHAALVGELEALVAAQPLRERLRGQLMLALYRCGRQAEALAVYREGRGALVEELGIEPGRQLQALERAILRQDATLELTTSSPAVPDATADPAPAQEAVREVPSAEERKVVSILLVDLVGFSTRSDLADPEDVRAALQPFRAATKREIERHGGIVKKLIGDAVMALFGAPVVHEDDPERAVRAALAIRRWAGEEGEGLQVRMAVNTGVALVSLDPSPHEEEATVAGDVINTTLRLQLAAPVDGILVGEQTYRATREQIEYQNAAPVEAKGKPEPIPAWEVLAAHSRFGVDLQREPRTPLIGRRRELDLLLTALARVREERSPQLVTLVGVPGIGKSRLVHELSKAVDRDGELISWRQGRCLPYGEGVSFWALGEAVKGQAGILESDSPEQAEEKLRRAVTEAIPKADEAPWVEQQLRPLVGAGGELGTRERLGEAFAAWRRFLERLAELRPLVLVLEDLHWGDEGLLEFVDELADRIRDVPLLVLCTARPELLERRPGWGGGKANALTISLAPLSEKETGRLVAVLLEQRVLNADVRTALLARAAGNPLYAEQFARMLDELGSLDELPGSVQGIIAARLDGLVLQEKALLQDAAVVGKVFWLGALEAIGGHSRQQIEELLHGLERKEFVQHSRRSSVADEAEYTFRHILLRDVAYGQIPRARRGEKHRRAAAWIESLGRLEDHAEMRAHHYLSAMEYAQATGKKDPALAERARLALRAAGDRALALAAFAAAARFFDAALALSPEDDQDRAWLLVCTGRASHAAGGTGIDLLEGGFEELRSRGDADGAAEVAVELARCLWFGGDRDGAYFYVDWALEQTQDRGASRARAHALVARTAFHMFASNHAEAIRLGNEALPLTRALGLHDLSARTLDVVGHTRVWSGDAGGLNDQRQAIALARECKALTNLIVAEINLYHSQFFLGQVNATSETLRTLRSDIELYGGAPQRNWLRAIEAYEAWLHGRWESALRLIDEAIADVEAGLTHYLDPACLSVRALIALARGELEASDAASGQALDRARRTKDPQLLAPVLASRSVALVAQERLKEASELATEVLGLQAVVAELLKLIPAVTPVEFAWLLRDLNRQAELIPALASVPGTPWVEAAKAVVHGRFATAVEFVARLGLPAVEAHTRLRAAEELVRAGSSKQAHEILVPALKFFRKVGATRYIARAEEAHAQSDASNPEN